MLLRTALVTLAALLDLATGPAAQGAVLPADGLSPPRNEIVFLGDSLTAGAGLARSDAFPAVIGAYWAANGISLTAVNAGVGGDTTADLVRRLNRALSPRTYMVFLEIGPNDGFRKRHVSDVRSDLAEVVDRLQASEVRVVLAQMWLPMEVESSGEYRAQFDAIYDTIGDRFEVPVMPAFLGGLVSRGRLWQSDGIHPTAEGARILARNILAFLNPAWILP